MSCLNELVLEGQLRELAVHTGCLSRVAADDIVGDLLSLINPVLVLARHGSHQVGSVVRHVSRLPSLHVHIRVLGIAAGLHSVHRVVINPVFPIIVSFVRPPCWFIVVHVSRFLLGASTLLVVSALLIILAVFVVLPLTLVSPMIVVPIVLGLWGFIVPGLVVIPWVGFSLVVL